MMMHQSLLISSIIQHASAYFGDSEIVSVTSDGVKHRLDYRQCHGRMRQLASALKTMEVEPGTRVATLAWNDHRHLELYYALSGSGAVLHTINPRLFPDQIEYILNHAEDKVLFTDPMFLPLVEQLAAKVPLLERIVVLCREDQVPESPLALQSYESLIGSQSDDFDWPQFDETTPSSLCYTSGTTGNPKGVMYTHRSTLLHTLAMIAPNAAGLGMDDVVLPVVPMFHVNAWGLPYAVPMTGAKLVLPGPKLDGESLYNLFEEEGVTVSAGVPTIWLGLQNYLEAGQRRFSTLRKLIVGGTAPPQSMIRYFEQETGIDFIHAWGMTETSPVGTVCRLKPQLRVAPDPLTLKLNQGLPLWGVELKIVDTEGKRLPHDGQAMGDLYVRGHWVNGGYHHNDDANRDAFDAEGWFQTGDVATINPDGYLRIVDRSKDVIKSGGEWISSVEIENIAMGHPRVAEAAVVGMPHPRWDERPLLVLVPKEQGDVISKAEMDAYFVGKIAKWWLPDAVEMIDELPHTATGKLSKLQLRERFKDFEFADAKADLVITA